MLNAPSIAAATPPRRVSGIEWQGTVSGGFAVGTVPYSIFKRNGVFEALVAATAIPGEFENLEQAKEAIEQFCTVIIRDVPVGK